MRKTNKQKIITWFFSLIILFIIIWPVYWIVMSSFTEAARLYQRPVQYLPVNLVLDSYRVLFASPDAVRHIQGTATIALFTILMSVTFCALAGYGFARGATRGLNIAFALLMFSTMVPMTVTVIPLMVFWRSLELTDTFPGIIILYFSAIIPLSTTIYSSFVRQIPRSLEEAAMIDGTTMLGAYTRIIFPLLRPVMATLCILNFIFCVNEFFIPLMFTSRNVKVLSLLTATIPRVDEFRMPWDTISAVGCLMLLPIILFILFFEKQIMEGLMMGSIKQ